MNGNNNLKLLITGSLNIGKSIQEINTQIKALEKKINKLNLSVKIDEKTANVLNSFTKAMEHQKNTAKGLNNVLKEEQVITKNLDGTVDKVTRQYMKSGEIIEKTAKQIDKKKQVTQQETQAINEQTQAIQRQGEVLKRKYDQDAKGNRKLTSETYRSGFTDTTYNTTTGNAKVTQNVDQERRATEALVESKRKLKQQLSQLNTEGKVSAENLAKLNRAIDNSKNIQQTQRLEQSLQNLNRVRENEHRIAMAQQQAQLNVQRLRTTHGGFVNNGAIDQYLNSVNQLTPRTVNLNRQLQNTSMQWNQLAQNTRTAAGATQQAGMSFSEMFQTASTKFPVWMAASTLFYQPIRQAQEFINILISVDDQLISLQKVMDEDTNFTKMLESATDAAFEFGRTIDGALESYNTFAKMGMSEDDTIAMGRSSMLLATVGDMNDSDASELLSAAMLQFNKTGKESIEVVDSWNEVSNNFAVTSNDLAIAISRSGQSADIAKTSFDELNGMVTAIQASTRRGGAQIGRMLPM